MVVVVVVDKVVAQGTEVGIQVAEVVVAVFGDRGTDAEYDILGSPFHSHSIQAEGDPSYSQD